MANAKLEHAREFTNIEDQTLDLWLQLENANLDDRARQLLDAGLMFEHFASLLDNDLQKRTPEEVAILSQLAFTLGDQVRLALDELRARGTGAAHALNTKGDATTAWLKRFVEGLPNDP